MNMTYTADSYLNHFYIEVYVKQRLDNKEEKINKGTVNIKIQDENKINIGEETINISDLGAKVKPGFGFIHDVSLDNKIKPADISEVKIHIKVDN